MIIAVDGHSSSGKSTFAKAIANEMDYLYIDSGAMYRAVTLYCIREGLVSGSHLHENEIINRIQDINIRFSYNPDLERHETYLNGENVEEEIRRIEVSSIVSVISKIGKVRERLVQLQREIGMFKGIVMDGRDIGTVVFPDADIKIFMTAGEKVRAERRFSELKEKGLDVDYNDIHANIADRDRIDSGRSISPLRKAPDAHILDNSEMTVEEQMDWFRELLKNKTENK